MIPADFHEFFVASTGASAALIGLLFVAISVAPERLNDEATRVESQVRAGAALIAFSDVLITSMIALIPGANVGWPATILGVGGIAFTGASTRSITEAVRRGQARRHAFIAVVLLLILFGYQSVEGILLLNNEHSLTAITTIAALMAGALASGIARAWQLVGMRGTGIVTSVATLVHGAPNSEQGRT